jgi:hypothetical protein
MTTIAYPTDQWARPAAFAFGETRRETDTGASMLNANTQVIETPYSHRWTAVLTLRRASFISQGEIRSQQEAFVARLKRANRLTMHHHHHPAPYGTMRGSPTLSSAHSQGATAIAIATANGNTLAAGDMIGITTTAAYALQLVRVVVGGTASGGVLPVTIEPALRASASSGAAVVWDKPAALWRRVESAWSSSAVPGEFEPIVLSFEEVTI